MSTTPLRHAAALAVLACLGFPAPASAQSSSTPQSTWTLGLGAVWSPSPYLRYDNKAWPLPLVSYEGQSFYVRGTTAGYRLFKTDHDEFSAIVSLLGNRFEHDDSSDPRLRRLSDRDISGLGGLAWRHHADWGLVQATAQKEFTGHGGGTAFDLSYGYPIVYGALTVTPTLGANYANDALNNYYYGVSAAEARRSGLPAYHAGGGTQPYLSIAATYRLTPAWVASAGMRYAQLPDAVKNSPMVDAAQTRSYFVSLSYSFKR